MYWICNQYVLKYLFDMDLNIYRNFRTELKQMEAEFSWEVIMLRNL